MNKIKKGDEVIVTTGKDRGRRGTVLQIFEDERVLVEGINIAKKHQKGNPNAVPPVEGGIVDKAMPVDISNVLVFNPKTKKGDRVGIKIADDGSKERIFRSTGETVDI
ncbi:MAG: 50S ribosomal protein L24 [Woeseiaceae bacterium]|jgi:large subunit ribosomal protein L24|nr:50S ribosomal protein L24 [Woeseiaceae bacterium]|tara:strand:+ start:2790 stop:3113 length:324 start_codon:yes stop_codon:yes gene_type:complete